MSTYFYHVTCTFRVNLYTVTATMYNSLLETSAISESEATAIEFVNKSSHTVPSTYFFISYLLHCSWLQWSNSIHFFLIDLELFHLRSQVLILISFILSREITFLNFHIYFYSKCSLLVQINKDCLLMR